MPCPNCARPFRRVIGDKLVCSCGYVESLKSAMPVKTNDQKLDMIIKLLQQANKSIAEALSLIEFLVGEKQKKNRKLELSLPEIKKEVH